MASHIEIVRNDGTYYIAPPDSVQGSDTTEIADGSGCWDSWLRERFGESLDANHSQWAGLLEANGLPAHLANNATQLFPHVARLVYEGKLVIRRKPADKLPPGVGGGDTAGCTSARTSRGGGGGGGGAGSSGSAKGSGSTSSSTNEDDPGAASGESQLQGDPVAPVTGEEILDIEDFVIDGPMPLAWVRRYRSGYCDRQLGLGAGWAMPGLRRIDLDDDHLWVLDDDARSLKLDFLKPGEMTWQVHTGLRLERRRDNRMILTEADGRAWILATEDGRTWWPTSVQNLTGQQWRFRYDAAFRLTRIQLNPKVAVVLRYGKSEPSLVRELRLERGDESRLLARYAYDEHGNLVRAESDHGTEQYQYAQHLLTHRELPTGYAFHFEWQGQGRRARCLRSRGDQGHHDFRFDYQPERYLTQVHDAHGHTQVFHYDDNGRIVARQDPDGGVWQWAYDGLGRLVQEARPDGATTRHVFDDKGRKVETIEPDGRSHRWHYNDLGFCIAERLADGRTLTRQVDLAGRLQSEQRADGSRWHYQYDADGWPSRATSDTGETVDLGCGDTGEVLASARNGLLQRFAFHPDGRVAGRLEQDLVTEYDYEGQRLLAVHQYPEQAPDQKRSRQYRYDSAGRLTTFINAQGDQHGYEYDDLLRPTAYRRPDGHRVRYQYDLSERLTAITRADGQQWQLGWNAAGQVDRCATPDGRDIRFRYNAAGHITHREHPGLWVQHTERDPAGRVLSQTSQGRDRKAVSRHYRYDAFGRRSHANCADRKLRWQWTPQGQVAEHHQDHHRIAYGYGPGGRLERMELPDGTQVHYGYDAQGRWHTLAVNGDTLIERTLDTQGRETQRRAGNNRQSQLHDRYGCLIKRKWQGQTQATRRYRWDQESRLEAASDSDTGDTRYRRDGQGQLVQENDTVYHYDLGGNRVPEGGVVENDRLLRTASDRREYDALGAEIRVVGKTTEHRQFDGEGQLIEVRRPGLRVTYGYDALGRRAWRKTEAGTTTYLWHGDVLLGEQSPQGQWQWYLRDPATDEPLVTLIDGEPCFYELDWRMMPIRLWSRAGEKLWQANANAWGQCQPDTPKGHIHQPIRLPGQFEDELTGIVQNRFREYEPAIGRYLQPDPLGLTGGVNSYRYTRSPVDYVDPLGLAQEPSVTAENAADAEMAPVGNNVAPTSEVPSDFRARLAENQAGMQTYWEGAQARAVEDGSFLAYAGAGIMRGLGDVAYGVSGMLTSAVNSPGEAAIGAGKSVVNFGPELFNAAFGLGKTSLNGLTLLAEETVATPGAFEEFRNADAPYIQPLAEYTNEAQQGGALLGGMVGGAAAARFGRYGVTVEDIGSVARGPGGSQAGAVRLKAVVPDEGKSWVRPKGHRLPQNGRWEEGGTPGNTTFYPDDPESLGLKPGDTLEFYKGYVDFEPYAKGSVKVEGLDGGPSDMKKIYEAIAIEQGFYYRGRPNAKAAERWLKEQELIAHHDPFDHSNVLFVPGKLHGWSGKYNGIRHVGSASAMRSNLPPAKRER
ncbi:RHS repeat-associated core domain-containing protein [Marinobacter xestospongiae]|uniref:RHS repeat-associated core domain-containing protein n=1 Tax=Marinobacter xestospongiae TaxID=994319 RepID=A0ABU3VXB1_9GAMM|nr:RHS repeat-associated core domain-containing protein [Marinobacter xestospongiae]MDV2078912.1 RHS repeat-associated core domain-containing protein [Marinobacter xestospongiae]